MNYTQSFMRGAATGATLGFAIGCSQGYSYTPVAERAVYGAIGAIAGAIFGGALAAGLKKGPVTTGAVLGGGAGALAGVPICGFGVAMGSGAPGVTFSQMCAVYGICNSITLVGGAAYGALSMKIKILSLKFLLQSIDPRPEQRALHQI